MATMQAFCDCGSRCWRCCPDEFPLAPDELYLRSRAVQDHEFKPSQSVFLCRCGRPIHEHIKVAQKLEENPPKGKRKTKIPWVPRERRF